MIQSPDQYRWRASELRRLAVRLEGLPALRLEADAGVDTWHGPRADHCLVELRRAQHRVLAAADDLRWQAWLFDRRADDVEAAFARMTLG